MTARTDTYAERYVPECDYCGLEAVAEITGAYTETDDARVCKRHLPKNPERIIARWTGTFWQAIR